MRSIVLPPQVNGIISQLNAAGYEAYAVGGCVRDALRGAAPGDWDITTSALPNEVIACFRDETVLQTGIKHGTVTLMRDKTPFEITTYRSDGRYLDGRHPQSVTFVRSLEEDLARRDFTVNAMAYHPQNGLIDPYGGRKDLQSGILRCVGEPQKRFSEDALRILRALRFSSVLGFEIERRTAEAVHELRDSLQRISVERIMTELFKLLCGENVGGVLTEFSDVIFTIIPELAPCAGYEQNTPYHNKDVWGHIVESVNQIRPDPVLRLCMLLHDVAKPLCHTETVEYPYVDSDRALTVGHFKGHPVLGAQMAGEILTRLKCSVSARETICALIYHHDERPPATERAVKRLMAKTGEERFFLLEEVRIADAMAQRPAFREKTVRQIKEVEELGRKLVAENACITRKQLAVNGSDLIRIGFSQGKQIGAVLDALLDAVIEGTVENEKETLLQLACRLPHSPDLE